MRRARARAHRVEGQAEVAELVRGEGVEEPLTAARRSTSHPTQGAHARARRLTRVSAHQHGCRHARTHAFTRSHARSHARTHANTAAPNQTPRHAKGVCAGGARLSDDGVHQYAQHQDHPVRARMCVSCSRACMHERARSSERVGVRGRVLVRVFVCVRAHRLDEGAVTVTVLKICEYVQLCMDSENKHIVYLRIYSMHLWCCK